MTGLLVVLLSGCTAGSTAAGRASTTARSTSAVASSSPAPTSTPVAPPLAPPADCGGLLSVTEVPAALGVGLPGSVSYVRGQPLPGIGRTDRITCGYGVVVGPDGKKQPPQLEISVSSYTDDTAATDRIEITTNDRQAAGDRISTTTVGDIPAMLLAGVLGTTLVFADGTLTYSLSLVPGVLPADRMAAGLTGVATAVRANVTAPG
ncbi:MAG: hypothetical protein ACR2KN_08125 [Geodermatophilaceae bacterium]